MIDFKFFYHIAEYASKYWKGNFSPEEIACNTYVYLWEFRSSKENDNTPTEIIKTLYELLIEDGCEQCLDWAYAIADDLGLIDMDYMDYVETDTEIIRKFLDK